MYIRDFIWYVCAQWTHVRLLPQAPWTSSIRTVLEWATSRYAVILRRVASMPLTHLPHAVSYCHVHQASWGVTCVTLLSQCFAHFHLYLKGREELVVTIFTGIQPSPRVPQPMFKAIEAG